MKKVLMISYAFPPMLKAASLHCHLFAKALPDFGWQPIILTVRKRPDLLQDNELLRDLPKTVRLFKTSTFDPVGAFERWRMRESQRASASAPVNEQAKDSGLQHRLSWREKIKRAIFAPVSIPDYLISWLPFAVTNGAQLISENDVDVIFSTSPPHSTHLIGLALSKLSGKPWVVEFQDPWIDSWPRWADSKSPLRKTIESFLESLVVTGASAVVANTPTNKQMLLRRYGRKRNIYIEVITNGYDAEMVSHVQGKPFRKFTICHAGTFYPYVGPYYFFEELSRWYHGKPASERKEMDKHMQVILIGTNDNTTRSVIRHLSLCSIVRSTDRVPLGNALQIIKSSDLLLVSLGFDRRNSHWVPLKLFTYLGCRRPILALFPEGDAAEIVRRTKAGFVVTSRKNSPIAQILEKGYQQKRSGNIPFKEVCVFDDEEIRKYEKTELTKKLARILEEVI